MVDQLAVQSAVRKVVQSAALMVAQLAAQTVGRTVVESVVLINGQRKGTFLRRPQKSRNRRKKVFGPPQKSLRNENLNYRYFLV